MKVKKKLSIFSSKYTFEVKIGKTATKLLLPEYIGSQFLEYLEYITLPKTPSKHFVSNPG